MNDHLPGAPTEHDDVVKPSGADLDERNRRAALLQAAFDEVTVAVERHGLPAALVQAADQILALDAAGALVDQWGEALRVDPRDPPESHDHRDRGAATELFALQHVGNVEDGDRVAVRGSRFAGSGAEESRSAA